MNLSGLLLKKDYRSFTQLLVFKVISLLPMLYLFFIWHGLTHPNFHAHTLKASLPHLNAVIAIIGFWFFFFIIKILLKLIGALLNYLYL